MPRSIWVAAAVTAAAVGLAVAFLVFRDDGSNGPGGFFQPVTPVRCADAATLNVAEAGFAAFSGTLKATGEEHLLIVHLNPAEAASTPERFTLAEPNAAYVAESGGPPEVLVFRVPKDSGAFKLLYRDDCSSLEWIVP